MKIFRIMCGFLLGGVAADAVSSILWMYFGPEDVFGYAFYCLPAATLGGGIAGASCSQKIIWSKGAWRCLGLFASAGTVLIGLLCLVVDPPSAHAGIGFFSCEPALVGVALRLGMSLGAIIGAGFGLVAISIWGDSPTKFGKTTGYVEPTPGDGL